FSVGHAADVADRFDAIGELAAALSTRKLLFVTRRGGLRPRGADRDLSIVNLLSDYDALTRARSLSPKQMYLLAQPRRLLTERVSHRMLIAVASPLQLLRELFTVKGAGTLIKRGSAILCNHGWQGVDRDRLGSLLASSFGKRLREGFFATEM